MACEILQHKTTHKGRENNKLQDLQGGRGECVWNISEQIQGPTGHNGAKANGYQTHCFDMCGVTQHAEDTPGQSRQGPTPKMT